VKAEGGEAVYVKADVSKAGDCENMVQVAEKTFGKVNILFNNAGIMHSDDNGATDTEEKIWDLTMNVNAKGVFFGCTLSLPSPQTDDLKSSLGDPFSPAKRPRLQASTAFPLFVGREVARSSTYVVACGEEQVD
jgi:NAD(P)-dependent dehydrogenase (short-subunit alcohol dehydrogenase family)